MSATSSLTPRDGTEIDANAAELERLLAGKKVLVVASTGGHIAQAAKWAAMHRFHADSTFVTFETPQTQVLLAGRDVHYVDYVKPRGGLATAKAAAALLSHVPSGRYDVILSTGAALAVSAVPVAVRRRLPMVYIESVSRFLGPSLTGRMLERVPFVRRFTQHGTYDAKRWSQVPSLLGDYTVAEADESSPRDEAASLKVVVTLGTIRPYRFDRMVEAIKTCLRPGDQVVWQVGMTDRTDLPGEVDPFLEPGRFRELVADADVVFTHAGVGTLLQLLDQGKRPLVFARRAAHLEHVDDHQLQVLDRLESLGLVIGADGHLDRGMMLDAARSEILSGIRV